MAKKTAFDLVSEEIPKKQEVIYKAVTDIIRNWKKIKAWEIIEEFDGIQELVQIGVVSV